MNKPLACPICGKEIVDAAPAAERRFPFCSARCRQIDFYRWCTGRYAIVEPLSENELQEEFNRFQQFES
jgi:hypothetical protein